MPYKNKAEGKEKRKIWREKNKLKIYLYNLLYNSLHPEMVESSNKKWYESNKDTAKKRAKEWKRNNPEKAIEIRKKEYLNNPEKAKADWRIRRARKMDVAGGHYTKKEFIELCDKYGNICLSCKEQKKLSADHVIPISKKGSDEIDNIQPLCKSCNSKKGTKIIDYRR